MDYHKWYLSRFLPITILIVIALAIFEPRWDKSVPWVHIYPCNMRVIDYMNGDIYIVDTVNGSAQLFHNREDAEEIAGIIEHPSECQ